MIQNASVVLLSCVDPYWVPGTCSEYFRSSSQELNHHLVSTRKMAGPQKVIQAAQNQQGTEGHIPEAPLFWGKHTLGEHLVGSSEGLGTGTGKRRGSERLQQGPSCSICLSYYCGQMSTKVV